MRSLINVIIAVTWLFGLIFSVLIIALLVVAIRYLINHGGV